MGETITEAGLTDWRKLAQGLHTRYLVDDFGSAARFVAAVGEAGDRLEHHPRVTIHDGFVDLARRITQMAADGQDAPRQRFHREVYVPPEAAEARIAAALATGGSIVDDSGAPSLTVIADQDGNRGVLCVPGAPG